MDPTRLLMLARIVHLGSAVILAGGLFFSYFLLRPTLTRIPPPQQVVINSRLGHLFVYMAWTTLALILISGLVRFTVLGMWSNLGTPAFWITSYGRWLAVMLIGWLVLAADAVILTFITRPVLLSRLPLRPTPGPPAMQARRDSQVRVARIVERVVMVNVIVALLAVVAGASLMYGGLL